MILTVTPNPALDLTYHVAEWRPGASLRVEAAIVRAGGKGLNVARVARQAGAEALAVATRGGRTGDEYADELAVSGLEHRLVPVAGATRRSVAVVDAAGGETTIMNERGAAVAPAELAAFTAAIRDELDRADCVAASGSLPPGIPASFFADLARLAADRGIPSVIDAVGPALLDSARAGATLLKPNRAELAETLGEGDPSAGARALIGLGARIVIVSLGEEGLLAADRSGRSVFARLPSPLKGNPTGAGDAAVAAAAVCLAGRESDLAVLARRAAAWSASAVLVPHAGELDPSFRELENSIILDERP